MCPERGRLAAFHPQLSDTEVRETDASVLGTATHLAIERLILGDRRVEALDAAIDYIDVTEFRAVQIKRKPTMYAHLASMVTAWEDDLRPLLSTPVSVEGGFRHEISSSIVLEGHTDFEDEYGLWDWKTAGGRWQDRYAPWMARKQIQPTFYTCQRAGWKRHDPPDDYDTEYFAYGVMVKGVVPEAHAIPTERNVGDWAFMAHQLEQVIKLYETIGPDEPWPVVDNGWHCSEKWCDYWWSCKGAITDPIGHAVFLESRSGDEPTTEGEQ